MLTHAVGNHWHAVVRDVLSMGFRAGDIFTDRLTLEEMVAIVVAAPPSSSLRYFIDAGWTREAHLLANLTEQGAGIANIESPYERPGLDDRKFDPSQLAPDGGRLFKADVMTWDEMDELDRQRAAAPKGKTTVRTW